MAIKKIEVTKYQTSDGNEFNSAIEAETHEKYLEDSPILHWEYCECGCKGYTIYFLGRTFWVYWDLKEDFILNNNHSSGQYIGTYHSKKEIENALFEYLAPLEKDIREDIKFLDKIRNSKKD